jgi:hypothetical protein
MTLTMKLKSDLADYNLWVLMRLGTNFMSVSKTYYLLR